MVDKPIADLFETAAQLQTLAMGLMTAARRMESLTAQREAEEDESEGPLLNVREVAARLSLPKSSVYMLIQRGDLPAVRFGKALRVAPQDLEAYVTANRSAGGGL